MTDKLHPRPVGPQDEDRFPQIAGTRAEEVARGRLRGEAEADTRQETGADREQRVARAMAFAAWWHDGRPHDSADRYRKEFAVTDRHTLLSMLRPAQNNKPKP